MKQINEAKLKAMGLDRVLQVCIHHAEQAVEAQEQGDKLKFERHCHLLDQCGNVGRELKGLARTRKSAKAVVNSVCST